jgi:hypothetical protein
MRRAFAYSGLVVALSLSFMESSRVQGAARAPVAQQVGLTIPDLQAYWPLDTAPGGITPDLSGNNNPGTLNSGAAIDAASKPAVPVGNIASANFPTLAAGNRIDVSNSASLNITGSVTVAAWVNTNLTFPSANAQEIVGKFDATGGYFFRVNDSGGTNFTVIDSSGTVTGASGTNLTITPSTWTHVAGVYNQGAAGAINLYVGGALSSDTATSANPPGTSSAGLIIGRNGVNEFNGHIDDVRIYDRALTIEEINVLKDGQPPPTTLVLTPGPTSMTVDWTAPAPQTNVIAPTYVVQRSTDNVTWTTIQTGIPYGTTIYNDAGPLTAGQDYYYRVFAVTVMESVPLSGGPAQPLPAAGGGGGGNSRDNDEGMLDDKCACGSVTEGAPGALFWIAAGLALLPLLLRRRA